MRAPCTPAAQARTCPSPSTRYLNVHSSRSPIGPRACSFCVELPISAPIPNSPPSVKRVEALTYTQAASTPELEGPRGARCRASRSPRSARCRSARCARSPPRPSRRRRRASVERQVLASPSPPRRPARARRSRAPAQPRAPACARRRARARRRRASARERSRGRNSRGDALVHEQRLGGVAHARPLHLRVEHDRLGLLEVGGGVDVDVAVARGRVDHRHGRDRLQRLLQALAAARDDQVDAVRAAWPARRAPRGRRRRRG